MATLPSNRAPSDDPEKLASALAELDDEWRSGFLRHTKVINPNFVRFRPWGQISTFTRTLIFSIDIRCSLRVLSGGTVAPHRRTNALCAPAELA